MYQQQGMRHTYIHTTLPIWGCFAQQRQLPGGTSGMSEMSSTEDEGTGAVVVPTAENGYGRHCRDSDTFTARITGAMPTSRSEPREASTGGENANAAADGRHK
jgi:hypothetical protein